MNNVDRKPLYADLLERLKACRENGFGFGEALAVVDAKNDTRDRSKKFDLTGQRDYFEHHLVGFPSFGRYQDIPTDLAPAFCRAAQMWAMRSLIVPELTHVVEVCAGAGDLLVSIARDAPRGSTQFISTDIDQSGNECAEILAGLAGVKISSRVFDITWPDFSFLSEPKRTLIIVSGGMSQFKSPVAHHFLESALAIPGHIDVCFFETVGIHLAQSIPGFLPLKTVPAFPPSPSLIEALSDLRDRVEIVQCIPDMTARINLYPLTFFHCRKPRR